MNLKACHHHGFTVSDLEQSLKFYVDGGHTACQDNQRFMEIPDLTPER